MKIKNKIFLSFLIVSIIGGAVVFFLVRYSSKEVTTKTVGSYNAFLAEANIDSLDRLVDRRIENWSLCVLVNENELLVDLKKENMHLTDSLPAKASHNSPFIPQRVEKQILLRLVGRQVRRTLWLQTLGLRPHLGRRCRVC